MKISIITVCFNSEKYISSAIESVLSQTYNNIEYIIIDGGSKDKTVDIIKSYGNKIHHFVSEPDKGIYDGMNKGFKMATGDYLALINSDDFYMGNNAIELIVNQLLLDKTDSVYADLIYVNPEDVDKTVRYWKSGNFIPGSFKKGWHPPHPTFIVKKDVYNKYGYFDLSFPLAADFELMLRFLEKYKISCTYLNKPLIKMRLGGATNKNFKNILKQNIECYRAFKKNGITVSPFYTLLRSLPKIKQYFSK